MQDSSAFLNLPGLKYLQKDSSVDWSDGSSSYLSFSGLKRMDRGQPFSDTKKEFLSNPGLNYLVLGRLAKVAQAHERQRMEEQWALDSSILFTYDVSTGDITLWFDSSNDSLFFADGNPATIQGGGMMSMLVYEGRALDGSAWIEDNGDVKITTMY